MRVLTEQVGENEIRLSPTGEVETMITSNYTRRRKVQDQIFSKGKVESSCGMQVVVENVTCCNIIKSATEATDPIK